jgi:uncharacterized protein
MGTMRLLNEILGSGPFPIWDNSIVLMYRGSIAHGTYIPNSHPNSIDDKDVFGITFLPKDYFFGLRTFEQYEVQKEYWDVLVYEFRKFIQLALKANPNVLSAFFTPEEHIIKKSLIFEKLVANRHLFLSKLVYASFCGYSKAQLYKMQHTQYQGYMGEKRKALVDKFGFDTKNAQHLIRLQRQGIELLTTGEFKVTRPDAEELKQIKHGNWPLDKVVQVAEEQFKIMEKAYSDTTLPARPDEEAVGKLVVEILYEHYQ